jgi:hypothetical protein
VQEYSIQPGPEAGHQQTTLLGIQTTTPRNRAENDLPVFILLNKDMKKSIDAKRLRFYGSTKAFILGFRGSAYARFLFFNKLKRPYTRQVHKLYCPYS